MYEVLFAKYFRWLLMLILMIGVIFPVSAANMPEEPLPQERVFIFSTQFIAPKKVLAEWKVEPGYFLYRDRIHITLGSGKAAYELPPSEQHNGFEVYAGTLSIPVTINSDKQQLPMHIQYQGCSQNGFCYPQVKKDFKVDIAKQSISEETNTSLKTLLKDQNKIFALLDQLNFILILGVFFGLGLLLAFTPCVLPMIPILTGIIVGQRGFISARRAFLLSLSYVLGMALMYAIAGLLAANFGSSLQVWLQTPVFILLGAVILGLLALSLLGSYEMHFSRHWQNLITRWSNYHQGGTYVGVFSMGALSSLLLSPCVTAPLIGVLMYIAQTGDLVLGGSALFVMGLGMGVPLILVGMSAGNWLPNTGPWMEAVKKLFGMMMLGMVIWLLSRIVSPAVISVLWALLLLGVAFLLMRTIPRLIGRPLLSRSFGVLAGVFALALALNAAGIFSQHGQTTKTAAAGGFTIVNSLSDFKKQLLLAKSSKRPVLVDFYADWCESCVSMEHDVFSNKNIKQLMKRFKLLRVDLSANNANDAVFMKYFNVIAPPTILFFTVNGREVSSRRVIGEVDAKEFATRINLFFAENCDIKQYC